MATGVGIVGLTPAPSAFLLLLVPERSTNPFRSKTMLIPVVKYWSFEELTLE